MKVDNNGGNYKAELEKIYNKNNKETLQKLEYRCDDMFSVLSESMDSNIYSFGPEFILPNELFEKSEQLKKEREMLIREKEALVIQLENGEITEEEFNSRVGEIDGRIQKIDLEIQHINSDVISMQEEISEKEMNEAEKILDESETLVDFASEKVDEFSKKNKKLAWLGFVTAGITTVISAINKETINKTKESVQNLDVVNDKFAEHMKNRSEIEDIDDIVTE